MREKCKTTALDNSQSTSQLSSSTDPLPSARSVTVQITLKQYDFCTAHTLVFGSPRKSLEECKLLRVGDSVLFTTVALLRLVHSRCSINICQWIKKFNLVSNVLVHQEKLLSPQET